MQRLALHILCVEDHRDTADAFCRMLRDDGHRVTTADSFASAMQMIATARFDLLLADIGLPDGSGLDLVRHWRRHQPHQRCIAISGYAMPHEVQQGVDAGFDHYLVKPILFDDLRALIAAALPAAIHSAEHAIRGKAHHPPI